MKDIKKRKKIVAVSFNLLHKWLMKLYTDLEENQ